MKPSPLSMSMHTLILFLRSPGQTLAAIERRRLARACAISARDDADRIRQQIRKVQTHPNEYGPTEMRILTVDLFERLGDVTYWAKIAQEPLGDNGVEAAL